MRSKVINRALLCLSETINDGTDYVGQDTFPIEQFVDEAGRKVIMLAPLRTLGEGEDGTLNESGNNVTQFTNNSGVITLETPTNYARLICFQMEDWKRAVFVPIYDTDPAYAYQLHPATMGGPCKPVVAITKGGTTIEAYSSNVETPSIKTFRYVAYNAIDDGYPEKFVEATGWMAASLYLASMGELDMSKVAETKAIENLQLL